MAARKLNRRRGRKEPCLLICCFLFLHYSSFYMALIFKNTKLTITQLDSVESHLLVLVENDKSLLVSVSHEM